MVNSMLEITARLSITLFSLAIVLLAACANDPASRTKRKLTNAFGEDAAAIEVTVEGDRAVLTGTVKERSTQELAEEVALSVDGVRSVDNRVSGPEPRGLGKLRAEVEDAALEVDVKQALVHDAGSAVANALEVEAAAGVVSLRGTLPSGDKRREAVKIAEGAVGVQKVIDLIETGGER